MPFFNGGCIRSALVDLDGESFQLFPAPTPASACTDAFIDHARRSDFVNTDVVDDLAARQKHLARLVVQDQVEVPLAEPRVLVREAVVGLGQHVHARRQEYNRRWKDR